MTKVLPRSRYQYILPPKEGEVYSTFGGACRQSIISLSQHTASYHDHGKAIELNHQKKEFLCVRLSDSDCTHASVPVLVLHFAAL
jgi:hypothetical protein